MKNELASYLILLLYLLAFEFHLLCSRYTEEKGVVWNPKRFRDLQRIRNHFAISYESFEVP